MNPRASLNPRTGNFQGAVLCTCTYGEINPTFSGLNSAKVIFFSPNKNEIMLMIFPNIRNYLNLYF